MCIQLFEPIKHLMIKLIYLILDYFSLEIVPPKNQNCDQNLINCTSESSGRPPYGVLHVTLGCTFIGCPHSLVVVTSALISKPGDFLLLSFLLLFISPCNLLIS